MPRSRLVTPSQFSSPSIPEGALLGNHLLCLLGFSGAILTSIMCQAMGRSITSVIFSGAGTAKAPTGEAMEMEGEITVGSVDSLTEALLEAKSVMVVPGYGITVTHAQFALDEIVKELKGMGKKEQFDVVAARMRLWIHKRRCQRLRIGTPL